jgi:hypothetical protein
MEHLQLDASETCAKAAMRSGAERDVHPVFTLHVELLRLREFFGIQIRTR